MAVYIGTVTTFDNVTNSKEQALKVLEEAGEVVDAWKAFNADPTAESDQRLMDELADVIQAVANLASAVGTKTLAYAMTRCRQRNMDRGRITL